MMVAFTMSACAPAALSAQVPAAPVETVNATPTGPVEITVMAAASLTESFTEIGALFEAANPGVKVMFNFAGSQQLAQQIAEGAQADVFASASQKYMDAVVASGQAAPDAQAIFARNRLVVILPADNPAGITALADLGKAGIKLDLAAAEVPVGKYALEFLDKAAGDAAFTPSFKEDVLSNVVSYEDNVKAVLAKVQLGEVDAGIVYTSDVVAGKDQVSTIEIPDALNVIAKYPVAPLSISQQPGLAQAFVELVLSSEGQAVLVKYGFLPAK